MAAFTSCGPPAATAASTAARVPPVSAAVSCCVHRASPPATQSIGPGARVLKRISYRRRRSAASVLATNSCLSCGRISGLPGIASSSAVSWPPALIAVSVAAGSLAAIHWTSAGAPARSRIQVMPPCGGEPAADGDRVGRRREVERVAAPRRPGRVAHLRPADQLGDRGRVRAVEEPGEDGLVDVAERAGAREPVHLPLDRQRHVLDRPRHLADVEGVGHLLEHRAVAADEGPLAFAELAEQLQALVLVDERVVELVAKLGERAVGGHRGGRGGVRGGARRAGDERAEGGVAERRGEPAGLGGRAQERGGRGAVGDRGRRGALGRRLPCLELLAQVGHVPTQPERAPRAQVRSGIPSFQPGPGDWQNRPPGLRDGHPAERPAEHADPGDGDGRLLVGPAARRRRVLAHVRARHRRPRAARARAGDLPRRLGADRRAGGAGDGPVRPASRGGRGLPGRDRGLLPDRAGDEHRLDAAGDRGVRADRRRERRRAC